MNSSSSNSLIGTTALVTGGSRGIGAAVALRLAAEGADVALTYVNGAEQAGEVAGQIKENGGRALALRADMAEAAEVTDAVTSTVAEFGRLDILVNNAGAGANGPLDEVSLDDVDRVLAVNVRGPYLAAQAAARHLPEGGRIINLGSCVAAHVPFPGMVLYAVSKSATDGLTKGLARELGSRGITVNQVAPGPIDTDMNPASGGEGAAAQAALTALGRYGTSEEIAHTVAHLASGHARYITGASVAVDGGFTA
ncbi:SDR family NAD(P)-dependent oxidoreductase [Streptomyces iconiensis]|uniref:3-oxoacyl-ACP reductase family protein n=1 Tax=Streptomyces iconiensis TaxID=1384038 RepID=A0ABT6ZUJ3_9ACTN|nr:3-oxoacyl-ACP reductase family protein [Streptomyces iconiensis]MDJ1132723.1 3-oxoacyl-ACP reductase family protein [Streptomyces iconiensis]